MDETTYEQTLEYIDHSYRVGVYQSLKTEQRFYEDLSPDLQNKLIMMMLEPYYTKFYYFFNDVQDGISADLVFIRKTLQMFDCQIYIKGTKILQIG